MQRFGWFESYADGSLTQAPMERWRPEMPHDGFRCMQKSDGGSTHSHPIGDSWKTRWNFMPEVR